MQARQRLQLFLEHADPLIAATSARLIALIKDEESVPSLISFAANGRAYSKTAALNALDDMGMSERADVQEMLCGLLADPNVPNDHYWYGYKGVRAAAAVLLLKTGDQAGLDYLIELADKKDAVFRRWYAPAILSIRHPAAEDVQSRLRLGDLWTREEQKSLKDIAFSDPAQLCLLCDALALIDDDAVDPILHHYAVFHSRFVRVQAARALIQRHGEDYRETVAELLSKQSTDYERIALAHMWADGNAVLAIAQSAADAFDRATAIDALTQLRHPVEGASLTALLQDREDAVAYAALDYAIVCHKEAAAITYRLDDPLWDCRVAAWELSLQTEAV